MDLLAKMAVAAIITLAIALGLSQARIVTGALEARLPPEWHSLAMPLTSVLCFGLFLVLRQLYLDQPITPLWLVLGLTAYTALVVSIRTLVETILRADRIAFVMVILGALLSVAYAIELVSRSGGP